MVIGGLVSDLMDTVYAEATSLDYIALSGKV